MALKHCSLSCLQSGSDLAARRSTRNATTSRNAITVVYGFVTASHPGIARSTARSWRAPHVFLPAVISRGTPIDDGVPLPLIPRHPTASARSPSSYGSFLPLGIVTDRGRYKSGSDYARLSRLSYDLSDMPVELTVIGRANEKQSEKRLLVFSLVVFCTNLW